MVHLKTVAEGGSGRDNVYHYCAEAYDEIDRLTAELEYQRRMAGSYAVQMDARDQEITRLRAVVVHAAACNPDVTGDNAAAVLRQVIAHARKALANEQSTL